MRQHLYSAEYCVFFFQAEDGIRDYKVTGVQTCALPIWSPTRCSPLPGPSGWRPCSPSSRGNDTAPASTLDRKSTRLNSSHLVISYAVFCLKKKTKDNNKIYVLLHAPPTSRVYLSVF